MPAITAIADAVQPLSLSDPEIDDIIEKVERLLTETLASHELFVKWGRSLPQDSFKLTKTKENVQVHRSRKTRNGRASWSSSSKNHRWSSKDVVRDRANTGGATVVSDHTSTGMSIASLASVDNLSSFGSSKSNSAPPDVSPETACARVSVEMDRIKPADRPLVIATGIIPGTVDDVAFGMLAHTERLWRHRDAHKDDQFIATKILATITRPTPESPFSSLTVKWCAKNVGMLSRTRDCVIIEANGVATLAGGERVAYNLVQSLDSLSRIPSFKHLDVVRVNVSTCYLARQLDQSSVEVYCRGFADQGGSFTDGCLDNLYADMVLSIVHVVDCAYVKKLVWLAHHKWQQRVAFGASASRPNARTATKCEVCPSKFSKFVGIFQSSGVCQACKREMCSKCCVSKKVAVDTKNGVVKMTSVVFCLPCVLEATRAPACDAARVMVGFANDVAADDNVASDR